MAKHIAVGVTGSIAAYKACELVRLFSKEGYEVSVVMTAAAARFVTPLTFRTLSRNPVCTGLFDDVGEWIPDHISIADRCDALVIAPCTANVLAKLAHGLADDALTATALACVKPLILAPAMNVNTPWLWRFGRSNRRSKFSRPGTRWPPSKILNWSKSSNAFFTTRSISSGRSSNTIATKCSNRWKP